MVWGQPRQIVRETPISKPEQNDWRFVAKDLICKCKAWVQTPVPRYTKNLQLATYPLMVCAMVCVCVCVCGGGKEREREGEIGNPCACANVFVCVWECVWACKCVRCVHDCECVGVHLSIANVQTHAWARDETQGLTHAKHASALELHLQPCTHNF
jgi:hypothetical protein